jgi:hypothetical protein
VWLYTVKNRKRGEGAEKRERELACSGLQVAVESEVGAWGGCMSSSWKWTAAVMLVWPEIVADCLVTGPRQSR